MDSILDLNTKYSALHSKDVFSPYFINSTSIFKTITGSLKNSFQYNPKQEILPEMKSW